MMDEIYVMDEIYDCMNLFVMMECKKNKKIAVLGHFAECCTRQRTPLPSAKTMALGKEFFLKKNSNFAECWPEDTRQRIF